MAQGRRTLSVTSWVLRCTLLGGPACQFKEETRSCLTQTGSSFSLNWDLGVFLIKRFTCCEAQDKNDRFWFKVLCFQCMRGAFMAAHVDGKGFWLAGPDDRGSARQVAGKRRQAPGKHRQAGGKHRPSRGKRPFRPPSQCVKTQEMAGKRRHQVEACIILNRRPNP